jgi:hypothetical protein
MRRGGSLANMVQDALSARIMETSRDPGVADTGADWKGTVGLENETRVRSLKGEENRCQIMSHEV